MFRKKQSKIFCISMQRNGTTSVGNFFRHFGYKTAGWNESHNNNWGKKAFDGDYLSIFNSKDFRNNIVFEDNPWGVGTFYKYLFFRFPDSKFILFTRDADAWFNSMMKHSKGKTLGNTFRHCCYYNRENEYYQQFGDKHDYNSIGIDNLLFINESHREHYKNIYLNRNRQVLDFFNSNDSFKTRFIHLALEHNDKWQRLGEFFKLNVPIDLDIHSNKSKTKSNFNE